MASSNRSSPCAARPTSARRGAHQLTGDNVTDASAVRKVLARSWNAATRRSATRLNAAGLDLAFRVSELVRHERAERAARAVGDSAKPGCVEDMYASTSSTRNLSDAWPTSSRLRAREAAPGVPSCPRPTASRARAGASDAGADAASKGRPRCCSTARGDGAAGRRAHRRRTWSRASGADGQWCAPIPPSSSRSTGQILNNHLADRRRQGLFTHIIGFAVLRACTSARMNSGYGSPTVNRGRAHQHVNSHRHRLTKSDGSRSCSCRT